MAETDQERSKALAHIGSAVIILWIVHSEIGIRDGNALESRTSAGFRVATEFLKSVQ